MLSVKIALKLLPAKCWIFWIHVIMDIFTPRTLSCVDLIHKSHNAPVLYSTMHNFITEMYMCAHFCYKMVHCGIFIQHIVRFLRWVHWIRTQGATTWKLLNPNLTLSHLPIPNCSFFKSFWNFAQSSTVILSCSVKILINTWQLIWMLRTN